MSQEGSGFNWENQIAKEDCCVIYYQQQKESSLYFPGKEWRYREMKKNQQTD